MSTSEISLSTTRTSVDVLVDNEISLVQGKTKKMHNFSSSWCTKKTDFGVGVFMHMDFLC